MCVLEEEPLLRVNFLCAESWSCFETKRKWVAQGCSIRIPLRKMVAFDSKSLSRSSYNRTWYSGTASQQHLLRRNIFFQRSSMFKYEAPHTFVTSSGITAPTTKQSCHSRSQNNFLIKSDSLFVSPSSPFPSLLTKKRNFFPYSLPLSVAPRLTRVADN